MYSIKKIDGSESITAKGVKNCKKTTKDCAN